MFVPQRPVSSLRASIQLHPLCILCSSTGPDPRWCSHVDLPTHFVFLEGCNLSSPPLEEAPFALLGRTIHHSLKRCPEYSLLRISCTEKAFASPTLSSWPPPTHPLGGGFTELWPSCINAGLSVLPPLLGVSFLFTILFQIHSASQSHHEILILQAVFS